MNQIASMMTDDHRACDARFVDLETHVSAGDWGRAEAALVVFRQATLRHLGMEEQVLFPAFEDATGSSDGPTAVMRMEHDQMRALLNRMQQAVAERDAKGLLGLSETLMVLMQQHNMKEEQMLYPMADQALGNSAELVERMRAVDVDGG